jgi:hypothetical protein
MGAVLAVAARAQDGSERVLVLEMLDNGSGSQAVDAPPNDVRARMVPWWLASGAPRTLATGSAGLEVPARTSLSQPIAAFEPLAEQLLIRGRVVGRGRVRLADGTGASVEIDVIDQEFELGAARFAERHGRAPRPRFLLELSAPPDSDGARFDELRAFAAWPCPTEQDLAVQLRGLCDGVVRTWLERARDADGPRSTTFLTRRFDAVTGEKIDASGGAFHPLYESLLELCALTENAAWTGALAAYLDELFELGFHPSTGLPRDWDGQADLPQDAKPIEVGRWLAFLLDVSERGPEPFRERALQQAERMAATILEHGQLADGSLAVKYVPGDGSPCLDVPALRRLDVAAQFARLSKKNGDARLVDAARVALAALEYTHCWGGTWHTIDPAFDDSFGHWGARAVTMLAAFPEDREFRRFSAKGFAHFQPLWRDGLRFGGSMASDQNRCWELLERYAEIDPSVRVPLDELLRDSIRAHLKGRQYANGSWGDSTFVRFSPRASLNIGDLTGYPANLLAGLANAYRKGSSLRTDETRAYFTAVLRSSEAFYRRKFGLLLRREESTGANVAGADLRFLAAAVEMLEQLPR